MAEGRRSDRRKMKMGEWKVKRDEYDICHVGGRIS